VIDAIQRRLRDRDREDGFTLIELMVVVMIIAILVTIAIPAFLGARKRAQDTAARSNLRNGLASAQTIYSDTQSYPATADLVTALDNEEPSIDFVDDATASTGAKVVSVRTGNSGIAGGVQDQVILAAKSDSGKCFFLRHVMTPGDATLSGTWKHEGSSPATCSTAAANVPAAGWVKA
jgi:prepilin-type N-terminal cleavage/methylation domain-containing protein